MAAAKELTKNRVFLRLLSAQFLSLSAVYALNLGIVILVELETHSSLQTGIVILTITVPGTVASLVAGPLIDRFSRRMVLVLAHLLKAVVAGLLFVALRFLKGWPLLLSAYSVNFCLSVLNQFTSPAEAALLPSIVRRTDLIRANSVFQINSLAAQGAGALLIGPLLAKFLGLQNMPLFALLFSALATINAVFLPKEAQLSMPRKLNLWEELQYGWNWIAKDGLTKAAVFQLSIATLIMLSLSALLPGFVYRTMGWDSSRFLLLVAPIALGFIGGVVILNRCPSLMAYEDWVCSGLLGLGASISAIALFGEKLPDLLGLLALISGAGLALVFIPAKTILQERPPAHLRGRVFSTQYLVVNASSVGVTIFSGGMADLLGIKPTMLLLGLAAIAGGVIRGSNSGRRPKGPGAKQGE
jgi:MFS family permease